MFIFTQGSYYTSLFLLLQITIYNIFDCLIKDIVIFNVTLTINTCMSLQRLNTLPWGHNSNLKVISVQTTLGAN